jgi:hypothetical protein
LVTAGKGMPDYFYGARSQGRVVVFGQGGNTAVTLCSSLPSEALVVRVGGGLFAKEIYCLLYL